MPCSAMASGMEVMAAFCNKPANHLRRNGVAGIVEKLDGSGRIGFGAKRNWMVAEAMRNNERNRNVARFDGGFGSGGSVIGRVQADFLWARAWC